MYRRFLVPVDLAHRDALHRALATAGRLDWRGVAEQSEASVFIVR